MNVWKKYGCSALAGLLLLGSLVGCTADDATTESTDTPEASASAVLPEGVPADVVQEILGISRDTVVATAGDLEITAEEVLYWVAYSADTQTMYYSDLDWTMDVDGTTLADYLMEQGLDTAVFYGILNAKAAELGCTISEEDQALYDSELDALKLQLDSDPANAEDAYQRWLAFVGISEEVFTVFNQTAFIYTSLQETLYDVDSMDAADIDSFLEEFGVVRTPHILIAAQAITDEEGNVTDDGMATALAEITAIREEIRDNGDTVEAFTAAMEAYSQDGRDANGDLYTPEGYTYDDTGWLVDGSTSLVTEFYTAGTALELGEISEPVQSSYGYHILMRLSADTDEVRSIYASYQMSLLSNEWMEELTIETTEAFDQIDPELYYNGLTELRVELQSTEEVTETESEETESDATTEGE